MCVIYLEGGYKLFGLAQNFAISKKIKNQIVDFLLIAKFWASPNNLYPPSMYNQIKFTNLSDYLKQYFFFGTYFVAL